MAMNVRRPGCSLACSIGTDETLIAAGAVLADSRARQTERVGPRLQIGVRLDTRDAPRRLVRVAFHPGQFTVSDDRAVMRSGVAYARLIGAPAKPDVDSLDANRMLNRESRDTGRNTRAG